MCDSKDNNIKKYRIFFGHKTHGQVSSNTMSTEHVVKIFDIPKTFNGYISLIERLSKKVNKCFLMFANSPYARIFQREAATAL